MFQVSAIKVKNDKFMLVGSNIPIELAYEFDTSLEFMKKQMLLPSGMRSLKTRVFNSENEALEAYKNYKK